MQLLKGFQVLNLAQNLPGPAAAQRFHALGAAVIKVEPPHGDPMELYHAGWYRNMLEGHRVLKIDMKSEEGKARLAELLRETDLLITATRPQALDRLGLGWDALKRKYPRLCQVGIVGFPAPRQNEAGHDLTYQAELGLITPPHLPRTLVADMAGAEQTVSAGLALLLARERSGEAGYAEVALSEAAAAMAQPLAYGVTATGSVLGGGHAGYNVYAASDGWIAVAALEPHFKERLDRELGVNDLEGYRLAFQGRTAQGWQAWGQELDIPIVAIR